MDLRTKTFLIIGLTIFGGILFIILFSFTLLTQSYAHFEEDDVEQKVLKSLKVLDYERQQLVSLTGDWSRWDETYDFVRNSSDDYVYRNLNYDSIKNLGVDYLLFLRNDNSIRYATRINLSSGTMEPVPTGTISQILLIPDFFSFDSLIDEKSGFIHTSDGSSIIVAQPIITSTYEGPSAGVLIFGEYLNKEMVHTLSDISDLTLSIDWESSDNESQFSTHTQDGNGTKIRIIPISSDFITGSILVPTLDSNGFIQVKSTLSRDIVNRGWNTIYTYLIILMVLGLVIIIVSLIMIDKLVLSRIQALAERIKTRIQQSEESQDKLLEGDDEFTRLAMEIHPVFLELGRSRRQLEEHVRLLTDSEKKYRELADLLPEFVFECDMTGNITFLNQMGFEISGYTLTDFESGMHILNMIDSGDHQRFMSSLQMIRKGEQISGMEYSGITRSGDIFPMIVYAAPVRTGHDITGFRGFAIDISERKEFETSLQKLANIVEHTSTGIVTGSADVVDYVNSAYSSMHGFEPETFIDKSPFSVVTFSPEKKFVTFLESALYSGHNTFELDHIRKDGTTFPVLHNLTILSGTTVQNAVWSLNVQNITDQRLAWKALIESEALRESSRQLRDVVSRLPDATFVIDKDGWVIFWNHAMENLTGIYAAEIIGRGKYEYAIPFYGEKRPMLLNAVLQKEGSVIELFPDVSWSGDSLFTDEYFPLMGKGGKHFSSMAGPLYDSKGTVIGAIQSMRDITSRIMAERALIRTNEKLNLLSSITRHDIRNRVTVILGLLPFLQEKREDPETVNILKILEDAAKLIQDQIEFSRLYQDLGINSPEWKDTGVLVDKVSDIGIPSRVRVVNELSGLKVYADPLLERVFFNLIDNALRHGGEKISIIRFFWTHDSEGVCIICEDDGVGIPDDLKEMIFERGYGSNTGLGLFLVREILSITGISIIETGKAGIGARFEIHISHGSYSES